MFIGLADFFYCVSWTDKTVGHSNNVQEFKSCFHCAIPLTVSGPEKKDIVSTRSQNWERLE